MNQEGQSESTPKEPTFIKRFDVSLPPNISENERKLFTHLVDAAVGFESVFRKQGEDKFYPDEVSDEDIERAAQENSDIFDHYTRVREVNGTLTTERYNETDKDVVTVTIDHLKAAADVTSHPGQKNYLLKLAEALLNGNYKEAERAKAEMGEEPLFDITLGYFEKHMDRRFGTKFAAMAWVGIKNTEKTNLAQEISDKYLAAYGWNGAKVRTRVDQTAVFSGFITTAPSIPSATSLPNQKEWRDEFGTRIIFFENSFEKFTEDLIPNLRKISDEASNYSDDEIRQISFKLLAAHESFHPVIRHEGDDERLGNEFTFVNELLCDLLARKVSADVSDLMTEKELRLAAPLLVSKALTLRNMGMPEDNPYMQGWTTALNYMISEGGVKIVDGKIQQGSNELVQEKIALLTKMFEDITKDGTSDDAKKIKDEYNKPEIYSQFTNL